METQTNQIVSDAIRAQVEKISGMLLDLSEFQRTAEIAPAGVALKALIELEAAEHREDLHMGKTFPEYLEQDVLRSFTHVIKQMNDPRIGGYRNVCRAFVDLHNDIMGMYNNLDCYDLFNEAEHYC